MTWCKLRAKVTLTEVKGQLRSNTFKHVLWIPNFVIWILDVSLEQWWTWQESNGQSHCVPNLAILTAYVCFRLLMTFKSHGSTVFKRGSMYYIRTTFTDRPARGIAWFENQYFEDWKWRHDSDWVSKKVCHPIWILPGESLTIEWCFSSWYFRVIYCSLFEV